MACVRAVTTARHCSPFRRCCAAPAAAKRFPSRGTNRTYANEGATANRSRGTSHWRARRSPSTSGRRSEEHTSELQSPCNLVCRLLLEKKKENTAHNGTDVPLCG